VVIRRGVSIDVETDDNAGSRGGLEIDRRFVVPFRRAISEEAGPWI
jgi:hypothetical protein